MVQAIQATLDSTLWAWRKALASSTSTGRWALAMALLWRLGLVTVSCPLRKGAIYELSALFLPKNCQALCFLVCYMPLARFSKLRVLVQG